MSHAGRSLLTAAVFWAALSAAGEPGAIERPVVEIGTATVRSVSIESWIPASIVSRSDARIATVIPGRVLWIAEVGTPVEAGAALARLDGTLQRLRLEDLRAQVARARAQQQLHNSQLERFNRLAATQVLSASQLEDARAQREMSTDELSRVEAQLREAEYEIAQSVIRAPFAGVVTERFIQRGEYLQTGAATVRLVNTSATEARATAALSLAGNVHPGQTVAVRDHGVEQRGRVRTVVPVGDDRSRQFEVRVSLERPEWLVGTPVEVSLPSAAVRTAVTVPRDALVIRQNRSYVLRLTRTNTVEELDVIPAAGFGDLVEVRGPLAAGDRLVIRGGERLVAGQAVRVADPGRRAAAESHPG